MGKRRPKAEHEIKNCVICGEAFEARNPRQITCGGECTHQNNLRRTKERRKAKQDEFLAITLYCNMCGKEFHPHFHNQKYCSKECYRKRELIAQKARTAKYESEKPKRTKEFSEVLDYIREDFSKLNSEIDAQPALEEIDREEILHLSEHWAYPKESPSAYAERQKQKTLELIGKVNLPEWIKNGQKKSAADSSKGNN